MNHLPARLACAILFFLSACPLRADVSFSPASYFGAGPVPYYLDVADLDGDGNNDVVTSNLGQPGTGIGILYGNGDGTLSDVDPVIPTVATGGGSYGVKIKDLNSDGRPDIVVSHTHPWSDYALAVLINAGNRQFTAKPYRLSATGFDGGARIEDFNGDGREDIFVNTYHGEGGSTPAGRVIVYLQDTNGDFGDPIIGNESYRSGISSYARDRVEFEAVGDFNNDGIMDAVVANDRVVGYSTTVLRGTGDGSFTVYSGYGSYNEVGGIAVGDLNKDGNLDFIQTSLAPGAVLVYLGNGDLTFTLTANYATGGTPILPWIADVDGDSNLDMLLPRTDGTDMSRIYFGDGTGGFSAPQLVPIDGLPVGIAAADMNGDGRLDIITANGNQAGSLTGYYGSVGVVLQAGGPVDTTPPSITIDTPAANGRYILNQYVAASFSATDTGSGVASITGSVPNGQGIDTASVGQKSFVVDATDNAGNTAHDSRGYTFSYALAVLFDQTKAHKSGSTVPIKLQLVDANQVNVSASGITIHTAGIYMVSTASGGAVEELYAPNDADFIYDSTTGGSGGYRYNLRSTGFPSGTYRLHFTAGDDPIEHYIEFRIK